MFAIRMRHAVAAVTFAAVAACGGDSATGPTSVFGTFTLQTVNGKPLPYAFADTSDGIPFSIEVMSPSSISVNADGTFRFTMTFKVSGGGSATMTSTQSVNGTYTKSGNTLSMTANGDTLLATWDGADTLTLTDDEGEVMVFKR